jgi:hypothetical protein
MAITADAIAIGQVRAAILRQFMRHTGYVPRLKIEQF